MSDVRVLLNPTNYVHLGIVRMCLTVNQPDRRVLEWNDILNMRREGGREGIG